MSDELMTTKELAHYLGIHEKQVYALVKSKKIPATRITGKWLFPKKFIDKWIEDDIKTNFERMLKNTKGLDKFLLASGSNDPILELFLTYIKKNTNDFIVFSANTGSLEGMRMLNLGYTQIAWSHLYDPDLGKYNIPYLSSYLPNIKPVVINLFKRDIGFLVLKGNPLNIKGFSDLLRNDVKFINRQKGSGIRSIIDLYIKKLNVKHENINGYDNEVYTHFEVGMSILAKEADTGIASIAISKLLGLDFIPIMKENFDMILDQSVFFEKAVQTFIKFLDSNDFKNRAVMLSNYDFSCSGKIIYA